MYTYSKKSRRRMHAFPAAIALLVVVLFWLLSGSGKVFASEEQLLLSVEQLPHWSLDCDDCLLEPQYDVLVGNVLRLQSRGEMVLSRELQQSPRAPRLNWRWTVDAFVERQPLLRLTVQAEETEHWPQRTLHYVWDSGRDAGDEQSLSDFEHLIVVNGRDSKAENWQQVQADLNRDWQRIYGEDFPRIETLEVALGMPGESGGTGGFVQQLSISAAPELADNDMPPAETGLPLPDSEQTLTVDQVKQLPATAAGE